MYWPRGGRGKPMVLLPAVVAFAALLLVMAQPMCAQIITTIAGTGSRDQGFFAGDGGPAISANLNWPFGIAVTRGGDVYVSDMYNNRIRVIVASSGNISTVVGTGHPGYHGDAGPGLLALVNQPEGMDIDQAAGVLYFADFNNQVVRAYDLTSGTITLFAGTPGVTGFSVAGGLATAATTAFNNPSGVAVDAHNGDVLICDSYNNAVWRVSATTRVITAVAGFGAAPLSGFRGDQGPAVDSMLNYPNSACVDPNGNVFIADTDNQRVRKITNGTNIISTYAGNGTGSPPTFNGEGGPANATCTLSSPFGVACDRLGNVFVVNLGQFAVRRIDPVTGYIFTVAGTQGFGSSGTGLNGDGGLATLASLKNFFNVAVGLHGALYIADAALNCVRMVTPLPSPPPPPLLPPTPPSLPPPPPLPPNPPLLSPLPPSPPPSPPLPPTPPLSPSPPPSPPPPMLPPSLSGLQPLPAVVPPPASLVNLPSGTASPPSVLATGPLSSSLSASLTTSSKTSKPVAAIGGAVGGTVGAALLAVLFFVLRRRQRRPTSEDIGGPGAVNGSSKGVIEGNGPGTPLTPPFEPPTALLFGGIMSVLRAAKQQAGDSVCGAVSADAVKGVDQDGSSTDARIDVVMAAESSNEVPSIAGNSPMSSWGTSVRVGVFPGVTRLKTTSWSSNGDSAATKTHSWSKDVSAALWVPSPVPRDVKRQSNASKGSLDSPHEDLPDATSELQKRVARVGAPFNPGYGGLKSTTKMSVEGVQWTQDALVDSGGYGKVYVGHDVNGALIAIKVQPLPSSANPLGLELLLQEIAALQALKHINVVEYLGSALDANNAYIFMAYEPLSLAMVLKDGLEEGVVRKYTRQILLGLEYVHSRGVAHRDIKAANMLVDRDGVIKLTDFGSAKVHRLNDASKIQSIAGTPHWMSPEICMAATGQGGGYSGAKADVWSLGITVIEMLMGGHPWRKMEGMQAIWQVVNDPSGVPRPKHASPLASSFMDQCLQRDPNMRATVAQLLAHPFVNVQEAALKGVHRRPKSSPHSSDAPRSTECGSSGQLPRPSLHLSSANSPDLSGSAGLPPIASANKPAAPASPGISVVLSAPSLLEQAAAAAAPESNPQLHSVGCV